MSYFETGFEVKAPYIPDGDLLMLREQWRPENQANWQPVVKIEDGEWVDRDDDYDTRNASLQHWNLSYVIPPAIAQTVVGQFKEFDPKSEMFQQDRPASSTANRVHAAKRFMHNTQLWTSSGDDMSGGTARTNFTKEDGWSNNLDATFIPEAMVPAPVLAKRTSHFQILHGRTHTRAQLRESNTFVDMNNLPRPRDVSVRGLYGWTIPTAERRGNEPIESLLFMKKCLARVRWTSPKSENLIVRFDLPQLSNDGIAKLHEITAEAEDLLPAGTAYEDLYRYHTRKERIGGPSLWYEGKWSGTEEAREQERCEDQYYRTRSF